MRTTSLFIVATWLVCFCFLNIIVKNLSESVSQAGLTDQLFAMIRAPTLYLAAVLYVSCALLYFVALGNMTLSSAGPLFMILGIVSTSMIGIIVFKETIGTVKAVGLLICLMGVTVMMSSGK